MKQSIGYTVTLNIMFVFITIVVVFLCSALIYFKSNKVSNIITSAIEKYEGYNDPAIQEISMQLSSIGYGSRAISCGSEITESETLSTGEPIKCSIVDNDSTIGSRGYCVYKCIESSSEYYYYKIRTNMMLNIPIINDILDIPIYSNTIRLYNFNNTSDEGI